MGGQGYTFLPNKSGYTLQPRRFGHPAKIFEPVPYSGTKSYQNLLVDAYGGTDYDKIPSASNISSIASLSPFSIVVSGDYAYYHGGIYNQLTGKYLWTQQASSYGDQAYYLDVAQNYLRPQTPYYKGYGFSIRCLVR